jgi:hypothetical protein
MHCGRSPGQRDERVSVTRLKDFAVASFADSWKNSAVLKAKTARFSVFVRQALRLTLVAST